MPFHQRNYDTLQDFLVSCDGTASEVLLKQAIHQLAFDVAKDKPIPMPEDFLDDEKCNIWKKIKTKLKVNAALDRATNSNIDTIHVQWSRMLFEKESKEANGNIPYEPSCFMSPGSLASPHQTFYLFPSPKPSPSESPRSSVIVNSSPMYFSSPGASPVQTATPSAGYLSSPFSGMSTSSSRFPSPVRSLSRLSSTYSSPGHFPSPSESPNASSYQNQPERNRQQESVTIKVVTEDNKPVGCFYFARKNDDKYVCQTDGCNISAKKDGRIKVSGVTRETLIAHAAKCHSIKLNLKQKIGIQLGQDQGFICIPCCKRFGRKQTFEKHNTKCHSSTNSQHIDHSMAQPDHPFELDDTLPHEGFVVTLQGDQDSLSFSSSGEVTI